MGYNLQQCGRQFHWSEDDWPRVIELAKRFGFVGVSDLTIKDTVIRLKSALWKAVEAGALPDMSVRGPFSAYLGKLGVPADTGVRGNSWAFAIDGHKPLFIHEDDPRWQGCFFWHLLDFLTALEDEPVTVG